jgi:hypothetical protein
LFADNSNTKGKYYTGSSKIEEIIALILQAKKLKMQQQVEKLGCINKLRFTSFMYLQGE